MRGFFRIVFGTMGMPGEPGRMRKGMKRMGALIWILFVAVTTLALERETFFP